MLLDGSSVDIATFSSMDGANVSFMDVILPLDAAWDWSNFSSRSTDVLRPILEGLRESPDTSDTGLSNPSPLLPNCPPSFS